MRALIVLAPLVLAACGSAEESTTIGGTTFAQNEAEGTATISNERGSITSLEGSSAESTQFPEFAPRYPGSAIESALVTNSERGERTVVMLNTNDDIGKVMDFYRDRFTSAGLEIGMNVTAEDTGMISAEGDGKKASVTGSKQDGKTVFSVSFRGS